MASKTLTLSEYEIKALSIVLSVDLDALGLDQRYQPAARAVLRKLKALEK